MAQYRVLQKSFINNAIVDEGEIVEIDDFGPDAPDTKDKDGKTIKGAKAGPGPNLALVTAKDAPLV